MRETRRTTALALTAVAVLAMTAACNGSKKHTTTPSPSQSPTPTAVPVTAAQARALANAGVLTPADMPGYTAKRQTHDASDDASDARIQTCLGIAKPTYLARNFGTAFSKGPLEVDSSADVAPTADAAKAELAALTGDKAQPCLKTEFRSLIAAQGGTVTSLSLDPVTVTVPGADAAFGYRIAITATGGGQTLQFTGFDIGALAGSAELDITAIDTSGSTAFTLDDGVALLKKVTDRAKAAA